MQRGTTTARSGNRFIRAMLILLSVVFLSLILVLPVVSVLGYAFSRGFDVYLATLRTEDTLAAIKLTLVTAAIVVPLNTIFGVAAAWAIAKFDFRGKQALITLIDLPFSVSPVIAGLMFVLLFGSQGWFGPTLRDNGIQIVFALPGIVLGTLFVTFPYVARELIPIMQMQGREAEEAAVGLGAGAWTTFFRVTLPNIRWGLMYGVILLIMAFQGGGWGAGILGVLGIIFGIALMVNYTSPGMGLAMLWSAAVMGVIGGIALIFQAFRQRSA
jgi:sulfate transport system permease protein